MTTITITNEDEAFDLLRSLVDGVALEEAATIEFEGWPRFVIRIKGEDFDGTIPTRIMPALLSLQQEVHRRYCQLTYGDDNARRLTKKDRDELELVVRVDKGSSLFETFLNEPIQKMWLDAVSKMTPEQLTAVVIVFGLSATSLLGWKIWINHRSHESDLNHTLELSKLEKDKMEVVAKAAQMFPVAKQASESFDEVRRELLTKMKTADVLDIEPIGEEKKAMEAVTINGDQAERFTAKPREKAVERIIEGEFFFRSVDFTHPEGIRAEVQRVADGYAFRADIPLGVLNHDQMEAIKNDSWNRRNMAISILVKELKQNYVSAKIISVKDHN